MEEPQVFKVVTDLLCVSEHEEKVSGEGGGHSNGYSYAYELEVGQVGAHVRRQGKIRQCSR